MSEKNTFKKKFNIILIGSLATLGAVGIIVVFTILSIRKNVENSHRISETMTNISNCQSSLRGFLLNAWIDTTFVRNGTNDDFEKFNKYVSSFKENAEVLKQNLSDENLAILKKTENEVNSLSENFQHIAKLIKERGFKDLGLEGQLRAAVHKLEKSEALEDKSKVLSLRKHEKDFFLRKDTKYLANFEKDYVDFEKQISEVADETKKAELEAASNEYVSTFRKIVGIETEIGLTKTEGLRGKINASVATSLENLRELNNNFSEATKSLIVTVIATVAAIFALIILLVLIGLNKLIKPVFEPMHTIQTKAAEISEGNLSVKFEDLRKNQVLKELIEGFEKIIQKFKTTMEQVEGISSRKILTDLKLNSEHDEVGKSLNSIITQIRKIDEEEKRRTWHNEGLAKFAEILRVNNTDETSLYDNIIRDLVRYLNANQGALFIIEGEENNDPHLLIKGCFAYDRKKYLDLRVNQGEGLAGMCWIEGSSIFLTEVPQNYVRITSGLGEATPSSIIIVPIKFNDKVQGVIEIASFNKFEPYQTSFTESIAESIGSAIHNMKTNTKTLALLQRSQEMTEELRAQEEEMRQNMEELQATQEEMARMSTGLQQELESLKVENEELRNNLHTSENGHSKKENGKIS